MRMGQRSNCHRTHHETQEFRFLPGIYTLDLQPIRKQEESTVCTCRLNLCVCVWGGGGERGKSGENLGKTFHDRIVCTPKTYLENVWQKEKMVSLQKIDQEKESFFHLPPLPHNVRGTVVQVPFYRHYPLQLTLRIVDKSVKISLKIRI